MPKPIIKQSVKKDEKNVDIQRARARCFRAACSKADEETFMGKIWQRLDKTKIGCYSDTRVAMQITPFRLKRIRLGRKSVIKLLRFRHGRIPGRTRAGCLWHDFGG
jgi:translation initiation factor IF-1